mgnify:CR=1 FL=1
MNQVLTRFLISCISLCLVAHVATADYLDDIGLTELRARDASLDGSGVTVAQVEAGIGSTETEDGRWQTDPANVGLSSSLFNYYTTTAPFPGGASFESTRESSHANIVAGRYYSAPSGTDNKDGIAPGVSAIGVYYANYFYITLVRLGTNINTPVVNQSFVFGSQDSSADQIYDNYSSAYGILFCNGLNTNTNPATIPSPASSYNGIAVGTVNDNLTPLPDGRSKPDIVAPGSTAASYTTPLVSGAATLLIQSGARGDADTNTNTGTEDDATDIRTIKALLLNSATKTTGWEHTSTHPLDTTNGAGILEVNQAQLQLAAGEYSEIENDTVTSSDTDHLPPTNSNNIASITGWNLSTLTNTSTRSGRTTTYYDSTDHYYFNCDATEASTFNLTATLVWNRNQNHTSINNLDLFLYQADADGTFIEFAASTSSVDNVEHLYELALSPGRYVLSVYKPSSGRESESETYALAFNFEAGATTYSVQEDWRLLNFGTTSATGDAADDADPEWDGLVNQIEFATGSDPSSSSAHPINYNQLGSTRQFSFTWRSNSGLDFSIGYSEDLSAGFTYHSSSTIDSDSSPKLEFIDSTTIDSDFDTLTYGVKDSVSSDKVFIQLQINTP